MRVFVAALLPDVTRDAVDAVITPIRAQAPALTWERPERWHITLAFLGEVDEELIRRVQPRLERAASRTSRLELSLEGLGRFGDRVLYAKVSGDRTALRRLADRTTAAARRAGADVGESRFRPHVTLARSRRSDPLLPLVEAGSELHIKGWVVDEFCLVRSVLSGDRHYEVLHRFALASGV
ncbi:MAG: RNA 2',3'-cyclic phosphodiesterase [Actinomycetes bacterium]